MRDLFLIDPEIVFLNHGSFGATPLYVMEAQRKWQVLLEQQPVLFLSRKLMQFYEPARQTLADYLHSSADCIAYIPNVTYGVNIIARSLELGPGDEILSTNHEYGACNNIWEFICGKTGAKYVKQSLRLPFESPDSILEHLWQGFTSNTKAIYVSHISSPTATQFPVEAICQKARNAGILVIVDGAHAIGQIALNLSQIDADFYIGNCHKWMLGPKGSGFLYTRPERQEMVDPLVVSWGWGDDYEFGTGSKYLDCLQWPGTIDPSAYLSVSAAIEFQSEHDWPTVRLRCHDLLREAVDRICKLTGILSCYRSESDYHQMAIVPLPTIKNLTEFQSRLYEDYLIEIPCIEWEGDQFIRISVQGYNTMEDIDALVKALETLLPEFRA